MRRDLSTVDLSRQGPATRLSPPTRALTEIAVGKADHPATQAARSPELDENRVDATSRSRLPSAMSGSSTDSGVELTILMPCLNEAVTLEGCIRQAQRFLQDHNVAGEVLIADNGSDDGSQEIAQRCGARVVSVPVRGYGAAIRGGSLAARGRFIAVGDADGSYDFSSLGPFLDRLRAGFDLVLGNRFQGGIEPGAMPWKNRYLGNPVLSGIGRLLFGCPVGDFHCGLRAYSKDAFDRMGLQTTGMELASEMPIRAGLLGMKVAEVPTTLYPDGRTRQPHLRPWRDGWRHLRYMVRAWSQKRQNVDGLVSRRHVAGVGLPHVQIVLAFVALALSSGCGRTGESLMDDSPCVLAAMVESTAQLTASQRSVDLGCVPPGGQAEEIVLLSNNSVVPLTLARIDASCECLHVRCDKRVIEPSEKLPVLIRCDMSEDLEFVGKLSMSVEAFDASGKVIASLNVAVNVDATAQGIIDGRDRYPLKVISIP